MLNFVKNWSSLQNEACGKLTLLSATYLARMRALFSDRRGTIFVRWCENFVTLSHLSQGGLLLLHWAPQVVRIDFCWVLNFVTSQKVIDVMKFGKLLAFWLYGILWDRFPWLFATAEVILTAKNTQFTYLEYQSDYQIVWKCGVNIFMFFTISLWMWYKGTKSHMKCLLL